MTGDSVGKRAAIALDDVINSGDTVSAPVTRLVEKKGIEEICLVTPDVEEDMIRFSRILLATDGSPNAEGAFNYARDLALRDSAQVILVHAFASIPAYLGEPWADQAIEKTVSHAEQVANRVAEKLQEAGVDVIVEVLEGPPADAVLRVANVRQCDLIVMGNRGYGEVASLLLGSVSHRVVSHAHVPVLIVRAKVDTELTSS